MSEVYGRFQRGRPVETTQESFQKFPLLRSSSSRESSPRVQSSFFNPFGTLRRSLREANPFGKNGVFRLPGTPRLLRSNKSASSSRTSLGPSAIEAQNEWSWESGAALKSVGERQVLEEPNSQKSPTNSGSDKWKEKNRNFAKVDRQNSGDNSVFHQSNPPTAASRWTSKVTKGKMRTDGQLVTSRPDSPKAPKLLQEDMYSDLLNLSADECLDVPPTPDEAREDLFACLEKLLSPVTSPAVARKRCSESGVLLTQQQARHHTAGSSETGRFPVRASQESLMSLMSSSGGTSGFGASQSPLSPRGPRKNLRSVSSGSSRGSFGDIHQSPKKPPSIGSRRSSGRCFPLNFANARANSHRSSGVSGSSSFVAATPGYVPSNLTIRPLFNLEHNSRDLDTPFLGREWLFRDIHETLLRCPGNFGGELSGALRAILIHSYSGAGKTSLLAQMAQHSPFHESDSALEAKGSLDSGFVGGSRLSLTTGNGFAYSSTSQTDWLRAVSTRVAAYHFCRVESSDTCAVPEFLCHIAAQLALCPNLRSYGEFLAKHSEIQAKLTLSNAMKVDPSQLFQSAICDPLKGLKAPDSGPLLIIVDGIDEAEYHRPESSDSIASFMVKNCKHLPAWIRLILTIRNEQLEIMEGLACRRMSLDDAILDERVWRDARMYVDYRLSASAVLRHQVCVTTGLPENADPLGHFAQHIVTVAKGNFLYLRLTLDLLEQGQLRLKSANYSVLPVSLPEVFLLMFNLKFASILAFEKVLPILSMMIASLRPLMAKEMYAIVNAGRMEDFLSWEEFCDRLLRLGEFLVQKSDDTYVPFHSAFRDWLMRRQEGHSPKFMADLRQGHALLALWLSRRGNLKPDFMIELGHHLLKAHPYKHLRPQTESAISNQGPMGRICQLLWIQQSAEDLLNCLCSERNMACPNTKVSRLLLLAGASPDALLDDGQPLLCRAATAGHADVCALLLEFGAEIEAVEPLHGMTSVMLAAAYGHLDVVQILHQHKAKLNQVDKKQRCALVHAAEAGHVTTVSFLLQCDWSSQRMVQSGSSSMTSSGEASAEDRQRAAQMAFTRAAASGRTKVCQFLLEMAEVSLDSPDPIWSETALCLACSSAQADTVQYLLSCGANLGSRKPGKLGLTQQKEKQEDSALLCAVAGGSWEIVSGLLARGLDADGEPSPDGVTPLMAAARHGHIGVMELLLSRAVRIDATDWEGRTALAWACLHNQSSCAHLLLDRGARLDLIGSNGKTVLHHAAREGGKQLILLLLERGCNLEQTDSVGLRALDYAVKARNAVAVQCFLRKGAKLGTSTWALARGSPDLALMLLQKLLEDGNLLCRRGRVKDAAHRYNYALRKYPEEVFDQQKTPSKLNSEQLKRARELQLKLLTGLARCKRRNGDYSEAIKLCSEAMNLPELLDSEQVFEARFLRAKCHFDAQDSVNARQDAEEAVKLCPASREARQLLQSLTLDAVIGPPEEHLIQDGQSSVGTLTNASQRTVVSPDQNCLEPQKSCSPADCSSDSGNQADFEDPHLLSPSRRSLETEL